MTDSVGAAAAGSLYFVGTATTVIRYGEMVVLTDPNFLHQGQRAYLGYGLSAKRLTEPAMGVQELPAIDAVLLSHLHGDHWDREAHRGLDRDVPVITTPHASKRLQLRGFSRALGLRTWGSHELVKGGTRLRVTAMPGRHAPGMLRRVLPPVMGSLLEFGPIGGAVDLRMYITGDTLMYADLKEIPARFPDIDTAVLHLGGTTLPGGLMVTMDGVQGADMLELISPTMAVPVHFDDYEVFKSPLSDFVDEVSRRGLSDLLRVVARGDTVTLAGRAATQRHPDGPTSS